MSLPGKEVYANMVGNLYTDLLVNDKLYREHNLNIDKVYSIFRCEDKLWNFYMRIYEILWGLPCNYLTMSEITPEMEGDAQLGNRIIRTFSNDWLRGAGRFANLCYTYIYNDEFDSQKFSKLLDAMRPANGNVMPTGLIEIDFDDGYIEGLDDIEDNDGNNKRFVNENNGGELNQITPFEYGEIIK